MDDGRLQFKDAIAVGEAFVLARERTSASWTKRERLGLATVLVCPQAEGIIPHGTPFFSRVVRNNSGFNWW